MNEEIGTGAPAPGGDNGSSTPPPSAPSGAGPGSSPASAGTTPGATPQPGSQPAGNGGDGHVPSSVLRERTDTYRRHMGEARTIIDRQRARIAELESAARPAAPTPTVSDED